MPSIVRLFRCYWCWLILLYSNPVAGHQCVSSLRDMCTFPQISTGHNGWMAAIRTAPARCVTISKLLVPSSAAAMPALLQVAGNLTVSLEFSLYREKVLVLTGANELQYLRLTSSPALEQLVLAPNDHLRELYIYKSSLRYLPDTIRDLKNLLVLSVRQSQLTYFSLGLFSDAQLLREVTVSSNMISVLVSSNQSVCIEYLALGDNRLTSVDMAFFSRIRNLTRLGLNSNRIVQLSSSRQVVLPFLALLDLYGNRLPGLQTHLVDMPRLRTVHLGTNNLTQFPKILSKSPMLQTLDLATNQISSMDLSALQPFRGLVALELSYNRITSLSAKQPTKVETLEQLSFGYNGLRQVDFTGCDFPKLKYLFLGFNNITTVPPSLFGQFPKVSLFLTGITMSCRNLSRYTNEIRTRQLYVDSAWGDSVCSTVSYLEITKTQKACCSEQAA